MATSRIRRESPGLRSARWCAGGQYIPGRGRQNVHVVIETIVPRLAALPGVVAVALGGSRALGTARPDSDWDVGLYYRGRFELGPLRALGLAGHLAAPGEWGPIMNGGGWLTVEGQPVDVLLRDLDVVERWWREAQEGRFEIHHLEGHLAGVPTYLLVGELAANRPLAGRLPSVHFPSALRESAGRTWRWNAAFSLVHAAAHAERDDRPACAGMLVRAALQTAHGLLASRGEWVLNEKGLLGRAGLEEAAAAVMDEATPRRAVAEARRALALPDLPELVRQGAGEG
jgi:predicted nucleotidyltransferase